mmetsp:Transcript_21016/g.54259  ORF Transcript_21016/g.54259 Transcript_21016/m.54259 type:complete len:121 (-) Transcript_21016:2602-2964(-)
MMRKKKQWNCKKKLNMRHFFPKAPAVIHVSDFRQEMEVQIELHHDCGLHGSLHGGDTVLLEEGKEAVYGLLLKAPPTVANSDGTSFTHDTPIKRSRDSEGGDSEVKRKKTISMSGDELAS